MTTVEKFKFETKSETLARLAKKGLTANILPFVYFEASNGLQIPTRYLNGYGRSLTDIRLDWPPEEVLWVNTTSDNLWPARLLVYFLSSLKGRR